MWNETDSFEEETPAWEKGSPKESMSRTRSVPDVSMSTPVETIQKAASDLPTDRPKGIPLFQTLKENEDLKTKNQLQRLEIIRLNEIILNITGLDKRQLAEEYNALKNRELEWGQERKAVEEACKKLENEAEELRQKLVDLEQWKSDERKWAEQMETDYGEAKRQLAEARERFPWMDESIDSIFGDPNQRFIGDLQQKIEELGYEKTDLIAANEKLKADLQEAQTKLSEWAAKGGPGDKTFAVDVGDLHKVTYQDKIEELQMAIDERDATIREQDVNYKKAIRLLTDIEKSKAKLEQQVASLTMTAPLGQATADFRESSIGTEERRMETATQWLARLATLGNENERLKKALIELGGKYREMSLREGSLSPAEIDSILNYAEEVQNNLKKHENVFNFSEQAEEFDVHHPKEISLRIINESIIAKDNFDEIKEKFANLKSNTRMLFERMKSSSELFAKILQHIKGSESELADEIRRMTLMLDGSLHNQSMATFEEIEVAFHEASWVLEKSISESFGMNLSQIMNRLGAGQSQPEMNKLVTKLASSPHVTPASPRFVNKQTFDELYAKHDQLIKEFDEAREKWHAERKTLEESIGKANQATNGMEVVQRQLEMATKHESETNLQCSELKEEVERLRAEESKQQHAMEELRRELQDRDQMVTKYEKMIAEYQDRFAEVETRSLEYSCQLSKLQSAKSDDEREIAKLQTRIQEITTSNTELVNGYQEQLDLLTKEAEQKMLQCEELQREITTLNRKAAETERHFEQLLSDARSEIASLNQDKEKELKEVEIRVLHLLDLIDQLAKVQGDENKDKNKFTTIRLGSDGRPLPGQVFQILDTLSSSLTRASEWTNRQLKKEQEHRRKIEEICDTLESERQASHRALKESSSFQQKSELYSEKPGKENSPPAAVQNAEKKFKDPLRNEFYDICTRADQIVQQLKDMQRALSSKSATELSPCTKILEDARTLRGITTQKYQALMAPVKDAEGLTNAELLERITIMWQQIYTYQTTLVETRKLLKETRQRCDGKAGCLLEDQAFGNQIENELAKIKDVLNRCGAAASKAKQGLVEQVNN